MRHITFRSFDVYKTEYIRLVLVVSLSVVAFFSWNRIDDGQLVGSAIHSYHTFTGQVTVAMAQLVNQPVTYDASTNLLQFQDKNLRPDLPYHFYNIFVAAFMLLFLLPKKQWQSFVTIIVFTALLMSFRAGVKSVVELSYATTVHKWLLIWLGPLIYLPFYAIVFSICRHNVLLKQVYAKIESLYNEKINLNLKYIVLLLIVLPTVPLVLMMYLFPQGMKDFVHLILSGSDFMLQTLGYHSQTSDKYIFLDKNWVGLEPNCLGFGVMSIILILIFSYKATYINKVLFSLCFIVLFNFFNSVRLAGLLVYINKTYQETIINVAGIHDFVSQLMYIFAFISLLIFIFWFSELHLFRSKQISGRTESNTSL